MKIALGWCLCFGLMIVGVFIMARGGWAAVISNPFPIEIVRVVYHTNEVRVYRPEGVWITNLYSETGIQATNMLSPSVTSVDDNTIFITNVMTTLFMTNTYSITNWSYK